MGTILDLHSHSESSEDSRAPVEAYLNWIRLRRDERPVDGIVLTEHRKFDRDADYRELEDRFGLVVMRASEVETDYGHMLVFGVNEELLRRFDFANVHLNAQELIDAAAQSGAVVVPCHPGRPTIGLWEHYRHREPLHNVVAVEVLNGGSRKGEELQSRELAETHGYRMVGGSDSHLVSLIGLCATRFEADIRTMEELVRELRDGRYDAIDFRPGRRSPQRSHTASDV